MSNSSADETIFIKSKYLYNNVLTESGLKHKIAFQQQKDISKVTNNTQNKKTKNYIV